MKIFKEAIEELLARERIGRCDFHTHSFLSDGVLLPIEQIRRAYVLNHEAYAITDHVGAGNFDIIEKVKQDCLLAIKQWGIVALPGIELTHVPVLEIPRLAREARERGALIIIVHGETINEPVEPGTNLSAAKSKDVDILAHPGMITKQEASLCKKNDIFVEITSNRSHSVTNGHIVGIGREAKAKFIQNTDTHKPDDMLTYNQGKQILLGAGLSEEETDKVLQSNVRDFLTKISNKL
ncbi:MAG: histidinol phosphate phosphatase domain-containing protein [Candidatus Heimdallarchaeota archaeon]|nr:histidinol phosphate phosphatase domain-containing protein [Candidatus Heimdallarchaeota archaeon]